MKKTLSVLLAVIMLVSVFSASFTVFADHEEDGIYYDEMNNASYYKGGVIQKGWIKTTEEVTHWDADGEPYTVDEPIWYYADSNGFLVEGWQTIKKDKYYFSGYQMCHGGVWELEDGKAYYFAKSGALQTGWIKETYTELWGTYTNTYYADANGVLRKGWQKIGGKWYCFGNPDDEWSGWNALTGVKHIGGKWYYFDDNGVMKTGWIKDVEAYDDWTYVAWYYADSTGALAQGWKKIGTKWYYFRNEEDTYPNMVSGTYEEIGGKKYLFDDSGALMSGGWQKIEHKYSDGTSSTTWYYSDKNGVLKEGWLQSGGKWYYFAPEMVQSSGYKVGKKVYVFDKSGALVSGNGWYKNTYKSDGKTYYDYFYLEKDVAVVGWKKIGGAWYYFDNSFGWMYRNSGYAIDGKTYAFDKNGKLMTKTGWVSFTSEYSGNKFWAYLDKGGVCRTGWQKLGGKWYYFNESGIMETGITTIEEKGGAQKVYFFDDNGVWISSKSGWVSETRTRWASKGEEQYKAWFYFVKGEGIKGWKGIKGKWYYFDEYDGEMFADGSFWIDDKQYNFDKNGVCLNP